MVSKANSLSLARRPEWLDCSTSVVESGINQSENGQITRLYYESYGDPSTDPGTKDGTASEHRRMLTLRAVDSIPFPSDERPTLSFKDADGTSFYLTQLNRIREYPSFGYPEITREMRERDTDEVLVVQDGNELVPIGVHVALAVPDHERMSPQLTSSK